MRNTFDNKEEKPFQIDWERTWGGLFPFFFKNNLYFIWLIQFFFVPLHQETNKRLEYE